MSWVIADRQGNCLVEVDIAVEGAPVRMRVRVWGAAENAYKFDTIEEATVFMVFEFTDAELMDEALDLHVQEVD